MKLISKLFCHHKIVLTTFLLYFVYLHAGFMLCFPCGSLSSDFSESKGCNNCADKREQNMNFPAIASCSPSNHGRICGCKDFADSDYIVKINRFYYKNINFVKYHVSPALSYDTIPTASGMLSHFHKFYPFQMVNRIAHFIHIVVLLL